ncbi:MAG: hypothetical protein FJ100_01955 [Deltaproteobacteria bacterium]|nr:hypothetical protein [Deltaproteobacteria bacterium]
MGRIAVRAVGGAVAVVTLLCIAPAEVWAKKGIGWVGLSRNAKVEGVWGSNTYVQEDPKKPKLEGTQLWVNFEGGHLAKVSPLGNVGGIEFGAMLGYDGTWSDTERLALAGGFAYNFQVGFPFTLFHQFSGGTEVLQLAVAPGFGLDNLHAYLYLKAKAAYLLTDGITAEAAWTWWPGPTSLAMERDVGFNIASTKGSVYIGRSNDTAIEIFGEYLWGEEETEKPGAPVSGDPKAFAGKNPFTQTTRRACCTNLRLGVGLAF